MTRYREDFPFPVAFEEREVRNTLAEVISAHGLRQLHAAETEKYAHVTYFFNGGVEEPWGGEDRILVPSPRDVASYDLKPEMSAPEVAARVVDALAEGLDKVFRDAGFDWRASGCSSCAAMNGDTVPAGERCASTSNRNFEGRQGKGARTHLVSPAMAAAAAVTGRLTDVRQLMETR